MRLFPTDVIACSQDELDREAAARNPFVVRVLAESLVRCARPTASPPA